MIPLQAFKAGIEELLAFLESAAYQTELNSLLLQRQDVLEGREKELLAEIASAGTDSKRYIYCVAIISLYGLLERLVDSSIETFINLVSEAVASYELMPAAVKDNHIRVSLDLAKQAAEDKYRTAITQEEVIANLHSCLSNAATFRVNSAAFVLHRGNITLVKISDFLTGVGIDSHLRRVTLTSPLIEYFKIQEPERDVTHVADQELAALLRPIDDLVDRRNQISHGVINVDEIESVDLLRERCFFLLAYGQALDNILVQGLLMYRTKQSDVLHLGNPVAVHNREIVCFEAGNCRLSTGDIMAASTGDIRQPFRYSPILSLHVDGTPQSVIESLTPVQFGAKVSFRAAPGYAYYVLPPHAFD